MDEPAHVDAFPVLGQEFSVRARLHDGVALLPAYKAFHEPCLFIKQFHHTLFLRHLLIVGRLGS
jgi:hypothetical protein